MPGLWTVRVEAIDADPARAELTDRLLHSLLPEHAAILEALEGSGSS